MIQPNQYELGRAYLQELLDDPYPGRIVIIGVAPDGRYIQVAATMGRGEGSRNRIYEQDGARVYTVAADESEVDEKKRELIFYNAMMSSPHVHAVSNGRQTDALIETAGRMGRMDTELEDNWSFETDPSINTARISGWIFTNRQPRFGMSILRTNMLGAGCERQTTTLPNIQQGLGLILTTYDRDGDPPPQYSHQPLFITIDGTPSEFARELWEMLDKENRVSLAVKTIHPATGDVEIQLINKYEKVATDV